MARARQGLKGSQNRKPGRPPVHDEAWTKVTVVLFNRQIVFLIGWRPASGPATVQPSAAPSSFARCWMPWPTPTSISTSSTSKPT